MEVSCNPKSESKKKPYEVGSLNETEEESNHHQTGKVLRGSGAGGDDTPEHHGAGEVDGGLAEFVQKQVGWD